MLNTINISISAKLATDNLMFDVNGNHIPNNVAINAGSPEKSGLRYIAFLIKTSNHLQIHTYQVTYNESSKCSAIPTSIFKWPNKARDLIMEKWGITIKETGEEDIVEITKDSEVPDPKHIHIV